MTVKERLQSFLKRKGITLTAFGDAIGVSNAYVSSMRKSLQPDKIEKIAAAYPDLNIVWLLTGNGEMINGTPVLPAIERNELVIKGSEAFYQQIFKLIQDGILFTANTVSDLRQQMSSVQQQRDEYASRVAVLEERVKLLEQQLREVTPGVTKRVAGVG